MLQFLPSLCAICDGSRVTADGFTLGLSPGIFDFTRAPCWSISVAARSKVWVCGRSLFEIVGLNPTADMNVCYKRCVLSRRGLCDGLITNPEESSSLLIT